MSGKTRWCIAIAASAGILALSSVPAAGQEVIGPPGYATQPPPATQPPATTTQPPPATTQPQPGWGEPQPGWGQPQPGWGEPQPGWGEQPQPVPGTEQPGVKLIESKYGSIAVGLILQARYRAVFLGDVQDGYGGYLWTNPVGGENTETHFEVQRARLVLGGHLVSTKLQYFLEVDVFESINGYEGGSPFGFPFWQQVKIGYQLGSTDKFTSMLWVGRMRPGFSLLLERPVHMLGAVEYPMYMMETAGMLGAVGQINMMPWNQTGIEWDAMFLKMLRLTIGMFNGPVGVQWDDENDHKDFLIKFAYAPEGKGITIGLNLWLGFPRTINTQTANVDEADTKVLLGLEGGYESGPFRVMGELMFGLLKVHGGHRRNAGPPPAQLNYGQDTAKALGFWVHFGYTIKDLVEIMVRFDMFDPVLPGGAARFVAPVPGAPEDEVNDMRIRLTLGPQFRIEKLNSVISLNYLLDIQHQNNWTVAPPANPLRESMNAVAHAILIQASLAVW